MCFGGGGSSTQSTKFEPPDYTKQPWQDYIAQAQQLSGQPLTPYQGQTVANYSPQLGLGMQMLTDYTATGTPERSAGGAALVKAMQGGPNPYATVANPYGGNSPYLASMINTSNQAITDQYRRGTAAQEAAMAAQSGAFGGSADIEQQRANQAQLGNQLSANTNNLLQNQYNQSAQLAESGINRATNAYDTSQGRALQAAGLGQGQQGIDLQSIQALIQGSQVPMAYQQQLLDAAKGLYTQQQQAPFTLADFLGGALSRASGGQGTTTQVGPGQNNVLGGLGALISGYGMFGGR